MLTEQELTIAKVVLSKTQPGLYKLKDIYGDLWSNNKPVTTFGRRFKKSVLAGHLKKIIPLEQAGDNAWMYKVSRY
jgi:hypothetical protein